MNIVFKLVNVTLGSREIVFVGTIASIVSLIWLIYDKAADGQISVGPKVALSIALVLFGAAFLYSFLVRAENRALRDIAGLFSEINEIYRNTLREVFGGENATVDPNDLLAREERVLTAVCQKVSKIFSRVMFGRPCMVTVKLFIKELDGKGFAHTYVRSEDCCRRDSPAKRKYEVGTGSNTAFDASLVKRPDGKPSHFFSSNLPKDLKSDSYRNERQDFYRHYKSALVVPIRASNKGKDGTAEEFDHIGYFCVDSMSVNWLNDGYHLEIMSSLANQIYNFMSLMRGGYSIRVEG